MNKKMISCLLGGFLVACGDGYADTPSPAPTTPDEGPRGEVEERSFGGGEAPAVPEGGDVPPVTVAVTAGGAPRAGVLVVFHDAAGNVLETVKSGADGKARSTGATPSMATALVFTDRRRLVTWTSLHAGDELVLREPPAPFDPLVGQVLVTLPGVHASATSYEVSVGSRTCTATTTNPVQPVIVLVRASCAPAQGATTNVLARALGSGRPLAATFQKAVTSPAGGAQVALTLGAWTTGTNATPSVVNVPAGAAVDTWLGEIAGGRLFREGRPTAAPAAPPPVPVLLPGMVMPSITPPLPTVPPTFPIATGFTEEIDMSARVSAGSEVRAIRARTAPAAALSIDFATALPRITGATVDNTDPARPKIGWAAAGSLAETDGGIVTYWFRGKTPITGGLEYSWVFVVAPGVHVANAPALPAEADAWLPAQAASPWPPTVSFLESDAFATSDDFRRRAGAVLDLAATSSSPVPDRGTNIGTRAKVTSWYALD